MAVEEPAPDPELPQDARIGSLDERLRHAQEQEALRDDKAQPDPVSRIGQQMFGHLIGAPFGGGVIGWGLDYWFGTGPLLFLLMLFFGFGVGVRNVIRISKADSGGGPGAQS